MIYIPAGIRVAGSTHTFLFADLVGFTALTELEGDARALEVALQLQREVERLLAQHGARRVKATGDVSLIWEGHRAGRDGAPQCAG